MSDEPKLTKLESAVLAAHERRDNLRTELATYVLRDAGIDPGSPFGKVTMKHYDGDLTPEAVRQYVADEYGVGPDGNPLETTEEHA